MDNQLSESKKEKNYNKTEKRPVPINEIVVFDDLRDFCLSFKHEMESFVFDIIS